MKLFSMFGIPLHIHWSTVLLLGLFSVFRPDIGIFLFFTFAFVILHEYGHCIAAKYLQVPVKDIIIFPLGGMARIRLVNLRPLHEFIIAIAGPFVNFVFLVFLSAYGLWQRYDQLPANQFPPIIFVILFFCNAALLIFNLIPVFPMDGGRILRSILHGILGNNLQATRISVIVGYVLGGFLAAVSFYFGFYAAALIFLILPLFAGAELSAEELRETLEKVKKNLADTLKNPELAEMDLTDLIAKLESFEESEKEKYELREVIVVLKNVAE